MRVLSHCIADGPTQMAWDEALLEAAPRNPGPVLRTYAWQPACLSLGYFQDYDSVRSSLPAPMDIVRRITGGGAIWHEHEVTYALVGQLGHDGLPARVSDIYPLIHRAVARVLGPHIQSQDKTIGDRRYRDEPRCFASPAAEDLLAASGGKLLGSAGRARGAHVLVHGSLKLASNPWDGDRVAGCQLSPAAAIHALVSAITTALGQSPEPGQTSPAEELAMQRIRALRYGTDDWVRTRRGPRP